MLPFYIDLMRYLHQSFHWKICHEKKAAQNIVHMQRQTLYDYDENTFKAVFVTESLAEHLKDLWSDIEHGLKAEECGY